MVRGKHKRWNMCLNGVCSNEPQWVGRNRNNRWCRRMVFSSNEPVDVEARSRGWMLWRDGNFQE